MSNIKNVVKVMNFHSLLRVDASRRKAEKYLILENEVSMMIDQIMNNKNFILDKNILQPSESAKKLHIYFGSDFGFCSSYNSLVNQRLLADSDADKIIIGRKLTKGNHNIILKCSKEEFEENPSQLYEVLSEAFLSMKYKEINIIFNRFQSVSDIHLETKKVYPLVIESNDDGYQEDYLCENDIQQLLKEMIVLYIYYEVELSHINTNAAENILRQNTTSESLKKIDERDEIELRATRKANKTKQFRKTIESYGRFKNGEHI
ncbi:MAG: F0F1 ATP synthase subunit gamma [Coprobacillus sp.]